MTPARQTADHALLVKLREATGLTCEAAARRMGLSSSCLRDLERGASLYPKDATLAKLRTAYGSRVDTIAWDKSRYTITRKASAKQDVLKVLKKALQLYHPDVAAKLVFSLPVFQQFKEVLDLLKTAKRRIVRE